VGLVSSDDDVH
jgi:transcription factor IIIB 90 kDa subunit